MREDDRTVIAWQEPIARRLRTVHLDTIRNQILVFAVAATLVPALAVTVASHRRNRPSLGDQVAPELRGASADAAWDIDQWLADRLRDLRVAATAYAVAENLARSPGSAAAGGPPRGFPRAGEGRVGEEGRSRGG